MVNTNRKTCERKVIEAVADNDIILKFNEKNIKEGLDHKNFPEIIDHSDHRRQICQ